jgi:hypothetical protein
LPIESRHAELKVIDLVSEEDDEMIIPAEMIVEEAEMITPRPVKVFSL